MKGSSSPLRDEANRSPLLTSKRITGSGGKLSPEKGNCVAHDMPIILIDSETAKGFCKLCLVGIVENDKQKNEKRVNLLTQMETHRQKIKGVIEKYEEQAFTIEPFLKENTRLMESTFDKIIQDVLAFKDELKFQLQSQTEKINENLKQGSQTLQDLIKKTQNLKNYVKKPEDTQAPSLPIIEQEFQGVKNETGALESKLNQLGNSQSSSEFMNVYTTQNLFFFLSDQVGFPQQEKPLATPDTWKLQDSVDEHYEPIMAKFVWGTKQVDCFEVMKNWFCTLTISQTASKDYDLHASDFKIPKYSKSVMGAENEMYMIGGSKLDGSPIRQMLQFNVSSLTLLKLPPPKISRYNVGAVHINGVIYVSGGSNASQILNHLECYDIKTLKWLSLQPMNSPRAVHSLCAFEGLYIYAIFGQDTLTGSLSKTIEKYEIVQDKWFMINLDLGGLKVKGLKGNGCHQIGPDRILIFGGADTGYCQFYYDSYVLIVNNYNAELIRGARLRNATVFRNQPLAYENKLFSFGADNNIHIYDISKNKWFLEFDRLS